MAQEIPLTSATSQTFTVELNGVNYNFRVIWNERVEIWTCSIFDVDFVAIVEGVPIVLGSDIIKNYVPEIGGLIAVDSDGNNQDALVDDLGSRVKLIYLTPDEVENGISV